MSYNSEHTHIDKVKVHKDPADSVGSGEEWSRTKVVSAIERDTTFVTILKTKDDKWRKGQDVHPVTIHGVKYIRTDKNQTTSDNLARRLARVLSGTASCEAKCEPAACGSRA